MLNDFIFVLSKFIYPEDELQDAGKGITDPFI
jgi:hypothetical protein